MSSEADGRQVGERQLGEQLARLAEGLLAEGLEGEGRPDAPTGLLAASNALLAIYWELRHQANAPAMSRWTPRYLNGRPSNHGRAWATEPGA